MSESATTRHSKPLKKSLIIGVTGGIGSGKTAATDLFAELGITVVDADQMSREVVKPGTAALEAIAAHFGTEILLADGSLDRRRLREVIFNDTAAKTWLESLLHPRIRDEIITRLNNSQSTYTILASPLLFETNQHELCSRVLVIDAPESMQLSRTISRDGSDSEVVQAIMASQLSRTERLSKADDVIVNDQDLQALQQAVKSLHQKYLDILS
jgi:dephospho-CoA kinase